VSCRARRRCRRPWRARRRGHRARGRGRRRSEALRRRNLKPTRGCKKAQVRDSWCTKRHVSARRGVLAHPEPPGWASRVQGWLAERTSVACGQLGENADARTYRARSSGTPSLHHRQRHAQRLTSQEASVALASRLRRYTMPHPALRVDEVGCRSYDNRYDDPLFVTSRPLSLLTSRAPQTDAAAEPASTSSTARQRPRSR
jgi:hypothetical protein